MADGNGNRELGEIQSTLRHISSDIGSMRLDIKDLHSKITSHCIETEGLKVRVLDHDNEIENLRKKSERWDIANSVGASMSAIVAGLIAWFKT